jgi:hypothetical protein
MIELKTLEIHAQNAVAQRPDLRSEISGLYNLALEMIDEGKSPDSESDCAIDSIDELIENAPAPARFPYPSNHLQYVEAFDRFLPVNWKQIPVSYLVSRYL